VEYFKALAKQLYFELERFNITTPVHSIYFGGGTPSSVDYSNYKIIFDILSPYINKDTEITIEVNPNSAKTNWLKNMFKFGANRISIGVQSFDDEKLKSLGRIHSSGQASQAVFKAKEVGFDNISIDIIYDTQYDSDTFIKNEIEKALQLPITHLSAYSLTIEEGSAFANKFELKQENISATKTLFELLISNGFDHYEISSFAKIKSRHNMAYWGAKDYIGVGAGAVGFLKNKRFYPQINIQEYINTPLKMDEEEMSEDELRFERVFMGLRSCVGVSMEDIKDKSKPIVEELIKNEKLRIINQRFVLPDFLLADEIAILIG